jgi:hypothetical protein
MNPSEPIFSGFTATELAACARRELTQRKCTYRHLVDDGKMSHDVAGQEIAMMQAIAEHFDGMQNPRLF